jgi:hypothetical protein
MSKKNMRNKVAGFARLVRELRDPTMMAQPGLNPSAC